MKLGSGRIVLVLLILLAAAMPVLGQNFFIGPGDKYNYIGPSIIPVTDTGIADVGVLKLEFDNTGAPGYIGEIVVTLGGLDSLGMAVADIGTLQVYLTNRTDNAAWPIGAPPTAAEIPVALITRGSPTADDITLQITDAAALVPVATRNIIYVSIDYPAGVSTPAVVEYSVNRVRYGTTAGSTTNTFSPGAPVGSDRTTSDINTYEVTFDASGVVQPPAQVEEGTSDVQVLQIDLGGAGDEAVDKELESVTFQYNTGTADTADITTGNVRLHLDGGSDGIYLDPVTDPQVGSATVSGSTVTVTTTPVDDPNNVFSDATVSYLLVVNVADRAGVGVGNVVEFDIANPQTDIAFRDEIDETVPTTGTIGEYDQAGYILATSVTITNNTFEILEKTVIDTIPPEVTTTSPADLFGNVSRDVVIQVNFSEAMATIVPADVTIVGSTSGAYNLSTDGVFDFATTAFSFDLTGQYDYSETITVTVDGAVEDTYVADPNFLWEWLGGDPLADYSFSFTIEDPVPPTVLTTIPVNGANDAGIGTTVSVVFSEAMDEATVTNDANFSLVVTGETNEIAGSLSYTANANTATFTPDASLGFSTSYTATATTGVTDAEGSPLVADYTFSFTTASAAGSLSFTDIIVANNRIVPGSTDPMRIFIETPEGLDAGDAVTIGVYTSTGRRVATLTEAGDTYADVIAGQPILWYGTNDREQPLGPGLYFVQVSSEGYRRALRVMIVR